MSETAAPKPPSMQRVPFATESAQLDSPNGSLERLVNFYAEKAPDHARSDVILKSTSALVSSGTSLGTGPIYAMNADLPGNAYAVCGTAVGGAHLFDLTGGSNIDMGPVGVPTGADALVTIAVGPNTVVVCSSPACFASKVSSSSFHPFLGFGGSPFPGASSVAYLDGYFVFTSVGASSQFFVAPLFDPDTISSMNYAFADAIPNVVRRVIAHLGRLWFMGGSGIEVWYNSGDADFPFRRDAGGLIPYGVMSPRGAAVCDGSIFWLGTTGVVFRTNGYRAVRVSTHAVERQIELFLGGSSVPSAYVADAMGFVEDGHSFFALTLVPPGDAGSLGRTFVYDCATELWHERSSSSTGVGRWRAKSAALTGSWIFGDAYTGRLFAPDATATVDDTISVNRIAISAPIWNTTRRVFMPRLEVETDSGGRPITLDWTDDGGTTWNGGRTLSVAGRRVVTTRLGSFRERSIRLTTTGKSRIHAVDAHIESGDT